MLESKCYIAVISNEWPVDPVSHRVIFQQTIIAMCIKNQRAPHIVFFSLYRANLISFSAGSQFECKYVSCVHVKGSAHIIPRWHGKFISGIIRSTVSEIRTHNERRFARVADEIDYFFACIGVGRWQNNQVEES